MSIIKNLSYVSYLSVFAIIILPISAHSESVPDRGPIPFATYDKDGNGFISEKEFSAVRAERMSTRATKGSPMRGAASVPSFSEFDTNIDGQLTQGELAAGQKIQREKSHNMGMGKGMGAGRDMPAFSEYDIDGDGKILEKELNQARSKRITERVQQGYQMRNLGNAPSFADIDTNGNGEISEDEFTAHQLQCRDKRSR